MFMIVYNSIAAVLKQTKCLDLKKIDDLDANV